ncbi:hypothetical protein WR25_03788 [Diploscapter pachys]|uniref:Uncharacterized protein n=1 Tax=Diploscapter pachys TaxID=2018661 RepID=A0A2A2LNG1_9BILA|nr:hypothetical protein WR25_03788 [Diploscapter pachys]
MTQFSKLEGKVWVELREARKESESESEKGKGKGRIKRDYDGYGLERGLTYDFCECEHNSLCPAGSKGKNGKDGLNGEHGRKGEPVII